MKTATIYIGDQESTQAFAVREEVARFAIEMEKVLKDNDWKGGWKKDQVTNDPSAIPFKGNTLEFFRAKLKEEYEEVRDEIKDDNELDPEAIRKETVDVANIAMMIADNWGELLKK